MNQETKGDRLAESPARRLGVLYVASFSVIVLISAVNQAFILRAIAWQSGATVAVGRLARDRSLDRPLSASALALLAADTPGGDDWKYDIVYRKKDTPFKGLVLEQRAGNVLLKRIQRRVGSPTIVIETWLPGEEVDHVDLVDPKERDVLVKRMQALSREREILSAQLKLLDPSAKPDSSEKKEMGPLPQLFADQFGWEEMAATVARVYNSLPSDVRTKTAIFGQNYGQAGAIDLFGPKYGLPPAISGHQTYFLWGPRGYTGESVIVMEGRQNDLESQFTSVEKVASVYHPYSMPYEHFDVFYCRGLKQPLNDIWPQVKNWD